MSGKAPHKDESQGTPARTNPAEAEKGEGSILGNILLEEVVEAIEAARSPTPDLLPPIPREAASVEERHGDPASTEGKPQVDKSRPDAPGHHRR